MLNFKRVFAGAVATGSLAVCGFSGTAAAAPVEQGAAAIKCVGTSFSGQLKTDHAICNNGYKVMLQNNGDLVLRDRFGKACYASGTRAPGDATATFHANLLGRPYIDIDSTSQGWVGRVAGAHSTFDFSPNASVNTKGEFWVGYKKVGWC